MTRQRRRRWFRDVYQIRVLEGHNSPGFWGHDQQLIQRLVEFLPGDVDPDRARDLARQVHRLTARLRKYEHV
jgi:hypothetical protein